MNKIASLHYTVKQYVEGSLYVEQTENIAKLLEEYKRHARKPSLSDYSEILNLSNDSIKIIKRHDSNYCLYDNQTDTYYLIELKIGGDLDDKKARSEKEAILE